MKVQRKNRKKIITLVFIPTFFLNLKYSSPPTQYIGNLKRKRNSPVRREKRIYRQSKEEPRLWGPTRFQTKSRPHS